MKKDGKEMGEKRTTMEGWDIIEVFSVGYSYIGVLRLTVDG